MTNFWEGGGTQRGGTSGQVGRLPRPWKRVSGEESQAASSIGRSRWTSGPKRPVKRKG